MTEEITFVSCPTCGRQVIWGTLSAWRPFCSKRCQLIDLGEWATGERKIPGDNDMTDSDGWSENLSDDEDDE